MKLQRAIAHRRLHAGAVEPHRAQQEIPVGADLHHLLADHRRVKTLLVREIGLRQRLPLGVEPFDAVKTIGGVAAFVPARGIGATEPVHRVQGDIEVDVVSPDFDDGDDHVGVEEEIDVGVFHAEGAAFRLVRRAHPHGGDVFPPVNPQRRLAIARHAAALAVEKTLDVGQEGDEFAVMALAVALDVGGEIVLQQAPVGMILKSAPMLGARRRQRHQLQWPEQDLAKRPHRDFVRCVVHLAPPLLSRVPM